MMFVRFHALLTYSLKYLNRKPLRQRPTAHLSYDQGLHLIRSFLEHASHHTVEELQAFTSQWVPHPQWVKAEEVTIADEQLARAAAALEEQLGPDGIRRVGGRKWWQWRKPQSPLRAEWIEMRTDHHERKRTGEACKRVMLYVHGGAYFFGSVDEHRYQLQRHARKLKARVFAPQYRLAPQFPFPCGLQDCIAAYLHLLTVQEPNTILLAGDSAGGGMVLSILVTLRDRNIPLPAGAILLSPWVDLTHSFPSVADACPFDYIPAAGFHHKPSASWPPPNPDQIEEMNRLSSGAKIVPGGSDATPTVADATNIAPLLTVGINGEEVVIREQIQVCRFSGRVSSPLANGAKLYTTNELLTHPLVSPVMQPTLGGLPPLLVMVGGGETLRDEQIYVAHKCANPSKYLPADTFLDDRARAAIKAYKPTDVQLQVWDDLCHVAPTLSFTRPAKYMYRSIAQFGAWALARAQKTGIDIQDDGEISVISSSGSDDEAPAGYQEKEPETPERRKVGKAGDALPPFKGHMIRQRVTRHGDVFPLAPATELAGCSLAAELIGVPKEGPVAKWLQATAQWETRYAGTRTKVHKARLRDLSVGYESFGHGEFPPPSALAGRRRIGAEHAEKQRKRSYGMSLWSLWGSKHDKMTVTREQEADKNPEVKTATAEEGSGARTFDDLEKQKASVAARSQESRSRSRRRTVTDERQTEGGVAGNNASFADFLAAKQAGEAEGSTRGLPTPNSALVTGVTGKRAFLEGIAMPFSLDKKADTASMMTLDSATGPSQVPTPRPLSLTTTGTAEQKPTEAVIDEGDDDADDDNEPTPTGVSPRTQTPAADRPPMETIVTAAEDLRLSSTIGVKKEG